MTVARIKQLLTANGEKSLVLGLVGVLFITIVLVGVVTSSNTAYALLIDGEQVALVAEQAEAEAVLAKLVEAKEKEIGQTVKPIQQVEIIETKEKGDKLTEEQLTARLFNKLEFVTAGVAIVINGQESLVLENQQIAERLISEAKNYYLTNNNDNIEIVSLEVEEQLDLKKVEIGIGEYTDYDKAFNLLVNGIEKVETHTVVSGESLSVIAQNNNLRLDDLRAANPQLTSDRLQIGQELNLVKLEPMISVVATLKQSTKEVIPFSTKYINDSSLYRGQSTQVQSGQRGEREVVYQLVQKNGITLDRNELDSKIINNPTDRIVNRGTKMIVASRGSGEAGKMGWPVSGRITSPWGNRGGGFHNGIDIAAPQGTPIRVADTGTVVFVGWNGGYGNVVDVDHGNGVMTRYAHNSVNLVQVGQKVNAGEVIARVGSTGRSTGPHVHFEVRINGQAKNPINYLP